MQKKSFQIFLISALLSFTSFFYSQNLVPNGSFETYTACPTTLDQIYRAVGWSSYGITPDYFHNCNTVGLGTPSNGIGFQSPSNGVAYGGFVAYDIGGLAREIIGGKLTQTLSIGIAYYVSLKVSLAEFDATSKQYIPCDKVGARFSTIPFSSVTPAPINNFSHIYTTKIISDTTNWTIIKGTLIADSNYQYIMIGNFFDDLNTDTTYRPNGVRSYFYVDEVCVATDSNTCFQSTSIKENDLKTSLIVYPNPTFSSVMINISSCPNCKVIVRNSNFIKIYEDQYKSNNEIDLSAYPEGVYVLSILTETECLTKKIIKIE